MTRNALLINHHLKMKNVSNILVRILQYSIINNANGGRTHLYIVLRTTTQSIGVPTQAEEIYQNRTEHDFKGATFHFRLFNVLKWFISIISYKDTDKCKIKIVKIY